MASTAYYAHLSWITTDVARTLGLDQDAARYEHLAGFRPLEPGYRTISFKPYAPAGLDHVAASYESVRGRVAAEWRRTAGGLEYDITVPPNAAARIHLPASDPDRVTEEAGGEGSVRFVGVEGDRAVYEAGSGSYRFRIGN